MHVSYRRRYYLQNARCLTKFTPPSSLPVPLPVCEGSWFEDFALPVPFPFCEFLFLASGSVLGARGGFLVRSWWQEVPLQCIYDVYFVMQP